MKRSIIYPGTFDPITKGHIDLIKRSSKLFDKVIVAIAANTKKNTLFSLQERKELVEKSIKQYRNIEIHTYSGLLIYFARNKKIMVILRGLRAISDFEYELQFANLNRVIEPKLETVLLTPSEKYSYISASMVREIASFGGNILDFVTKDVQQALKRKFSKIKK